MPQERLPINKPVIEWKTLANKPGSPEDSPEFLYANARNVKLFRAIFEKEGFLYTPDRDFVLAPKFRGYATAGEDEELDLMAFDGMLFNNPAHTSLELIDCSEKKQSRFWRVKKDFFTVGETLFPEDDFFLMMGAHFDSPQVPTKGFTKRPMTLENLHYHTLGLPKKKLIDAPNAEFNEYTEAVHLFDHPDVHRAFESMPFSPGELKFMRPIIDEEKSETVPDPRMAPNGMLFELPGLEAFEDSEFQREFMSVYRGYHLFFEVVMTTTSALTVLGPDNIQRGKNAMFTLSHCPGLERIMKENRDLAEFMFDHLFKNGAGRANINRQTRMDEEHLPHLARRNHVRQHVSHSSGIYRNNGKYYFFFRPLIHSGGRITEALNIHLTREVDPEAFAKSIHLMRHNMTRFVDALDQCPGYEKSKENMDAFYKAA